jgi:ADP-ribosylglycohydrolase
LRDFRKGVLLAVNHGGDSDSTGAITGNILGALLGRSSIPDEWITQVELADVINGVAMDLYNADHLGVIDCVKYPPN